MIEHDAYWAEMASEAPMDAEELVQLSSVAASYSGKAPLALVRHCLYFLLVS